MEDGREDERWQEHKRLQTDRADHGHREQKLALPEHRRFLENTGQGNQGANDERVEQSLAHHQPRVSERRHQQRERRRGECQPRLHQPSRPEIHRHGGDGDDECLHCLDDLDRPSGVPQQHRRTDQRGVEKAVVGGRGVPHRQGAVQPQRPPDRRIEHLVGGDPRHRERLRSRKPDRRRHNNQRRKRKKPTTTIRPLHHSLDIVSRASKAGENLRLSRTGYRPTELSEGHGAAAWQKPVPGHDNGPPAGCRSPAGGPETLRLRAPETTSF